MIKGWLHFWSKQLLRTQLLLSFILLLLIIFGVSSGFLYTSILNTLQERSEKATIGSFRQVEYSIASFRKEVDSISKTVMMEPSLERYLQADTYRDLEYIKILNSTKDKMTGIMYSYPYIQSIYLFTGDGRVAGVNGSGFVSRKNMQNHWFYASSVYQKANEQYPQISWIGGLQVAQFEGALTLREAQHFDTYLLSASRGIKTFPQSERSGILVINVYETKIFDAYRNLTSPQSGRVYILDTDGTIIPDSAKDGSLGGQASFRERLDSKYGSFTMTTKNEGYQIIYYRIQDTGWTLCMEIPISVYKQDITRLRSTILYIIVFSLAVAILLSYYWTKKLTKPFYTLVKGMRTLEQGHVGMTIVHSQNNELGIVINAFNSMSRSIHELLERNQKIEMDKRHAEMQVLQAHINPHFLYNTLNTIKWMAISIHATNIMESITALGSLIQLVFRGTVPMISLEEEIDYLHHYMIIMNKRYGEGIQLHIQIDEHLHSALVPRLILQPILENALLHGLQSNHYRGNIWIEGREKQGEMILSVKDNGAGIPSDQLQEIEAALRETEQLAQESGQGIGLLNVHHRIRLHYGSRYGMSIYSLEGEGTTVMLELPVVQKS